VLLQPWQVTFRLLCSGITIVGWLHHQNKNTDVLAAPAVRPYTECLEAGTPFKIQFKKT
jgi:hypothetical protein